jgi:hypothetical protein
MIVDRIEGTRAVVEIEGELIDLPLSALPADVKEGDRLSVVVVPADPTEAQARLARLRARTPQGGGDIDL